MFQGKKKSNKAPLLILVIAVSVIIILDMIGKPVIEKIHIPDVIAKGITGIIVFSAIYFSTLLSSSSKAFYFLFLGLTLYFFSVQVDFLEEIIFRPQEGFYEILEHFGAMFGILLVSAGIFFLGVELRHSNQWRYEMATGAGRVGVWDWNLETHEFYADPHLKAMLGYKDNEVPNRIDYWSKLVHPDDREGMVDKALSYLKGELPYYELVRRMIHKDGTIKWFLTRGSALKDQIGKPYRIIGTDTDISDQRMLETQLVQSQKMEAVGRLTGGVAHDFNNLLAVIIGSAGLLEKKLSGDAYLLKQIKRIQHSAKRGSDLTKKLLGFSRLEKKEPQKIDLKQCVETVIGILEHSIDKRIVIKNEMCKEPAITLADESQLELAIMNLAVNACDAIEPVIDKREYCELSFKIEIENISEVFAEKHQIQSGCDYVHLSVCDTGIGIPEDMLQEIFEPFFTTKESEKGTGLGLSIAYGTVKSYGGAITLSSTVGYGSEFHIFLPKYV